MVFLIFSLKEEKREKTTFWDLNWQVALGFWHLCLNCIFLLSLLQLLLHKSSTFFSTNCMGGEDKLGSSTSFLVPVFTSFRSCPGFKIHLSGIFFIIKLLSSFCPSLQMRTWYKATAPTKWQSDFSAVKAKVVLTVAPWYPEGWWRWPRSRKELQLPGFQVAPRRSLGWLGRCCCIAAPAQRGRCCSAPSFPKLCCLGP